MINRDFDDVWNDIPKESEITSSRLSIVDSIRGLDLKLVSADPGRIRYFALKWDEWCWKQVEWKLAKYVCPKGKRSV